MHSDPFDIPAKHVPRGMVYQWVAVTVLGKPPIGIRLEDFLTNGWHRVPAFRHSSLFPQCRDQEYIEIDGLALVELPIDEAEKRRDLEVEKAARALAVVTEALRGRETFPASSVANYAWQDYTHSLAHERRAPEGSWLRRLINARRRFKFIWYGLSEREMAAAQDGTIRWNLNASGHDPNAVIGLREYARRKRIMKREGRYHD